MHVKRDHEATGTQLFQAGFDSFPSKGYGTIFYKVVDGAITLYSQVRNAPFYSKDLIDVDSTSVVSDMLANGYLEIENGKYVATE